MADYEAPSIVELGSVVDFTQGRYESSFSFASGNGNGNNGNGNGNGGGNGKGPSS